VNFFYRTPEEADQRYWRQWDELQALLELWAANAEREAAANGNGLSPEAQRFIQHVRQHAALR
jgi:hypothetical protein